MSVRTAGLAIRYLAQIRTLKADFSRSDANSQQVLTIAAPGEGKAIVLGSAAAFYSDQSKQDVTVAYTDRDDAAKSITVTTGSSSPPARQIFPMLDVAGIVTKENTAVTITAPAGGADVTSDIRATWAEVSEELLGDVIAGGDA